MLRKIGYLSILALAALALAGPARAEEQVPFKGQGSGILNADFTINGVGEVSHMGRTTIANSAPDSVVTFTATNGDKLLLIVTERVMIDSTHFVNDHQIIGGTGRFEGATGTFLTPLEFACPAGSPSCDFPVSFTWTLEGTISSPGASK